MAALSVAGCLGAGDDDPDLGLDDEDDPDTEPGDDDPDESPEASDGDEPLLSEDYDSFVSETWHAMEMDDDEPLHTDTYGEWDLQSGDAFSSIHMYQGDDEGTTIEYYRVDDVTYQRHIEAETCHPFEQDVMPSFRRVADIQLPDADSVGESGFELVGTDEVDGEAVSVWYFDLAEAIEFQEGELTMYVSETTNYLLYVEGWYSVGGPDSDAQMSFEQRRHSFNEPVVVEVPPDC